MNGFPQYSVCMQETHHVHKLDAPSGTAITLAEEIIDNIDRKKDWKRGVTYWTEDGHHDEGDANITDEDLVINCVRDGEVPGIHAVMYDSDADMITIEHSAHSRKGFALGAVLAAEFTANHSGLLTTTMLVLFLRGLLFGKLSSVFLPMTTTFPVVISRKNFWSIGIRTSNWLFFPIAQLLSTAAIKFMIFSLL